MTLPTPKRAVAAWVEPAVAEFARQAGIDAPPLVVQRPARPEHGDLAISAAMQMARAARRPPVEIAEAIAAAIPLGGPVAAAEVAPPGFINVRLSQDWMFQSLTAVVEAGEGWGRLDFGGGARVQVEFVSVNPTGPLAFSHGRGAVLGDTVARLLAFTGHDVEREFYINDAGRQVQLFGASILARRLGEEVPEDGYRGEYVEEYAEASSAAVADEDLHRLIAAGQRDEATARLTAWGIAAVLDEFRADLEGLGIGFDSWFSERTLYGDWERDTIDALRARGAITEHDGATWVRFPDGKEDVLYKSNGEPTYFLGDLLYHRDKLVRRAFQVAVDIWGADHQNQVRRMKQLMELIGVEPSRLDILVFQWVRMKGEQGFIKISKRAGNLILLRDLVDAVGADATRYHYLLRSADSPMDFDVELARRQSNENPVFYAQMAHARLCSIKAVAAEAGLTASAEHLDRLDAAGEVQVAREVLEFPDIVEEAAANREPHHLPHYAQRLAERIHAFYHVGAKDATLRVVGDDADVSGARLYLCEAARQTMANALSLMGVSAPDRM